MDNAGLALVPDPSLQAQRNLIVIFAIKFITMGAWKQLGVLLIALVWVIQANFLLKGPNKTQDEKK